jgi:hypothetical protein
MNPLSLEQRRRELGMPLAALSVRSGVPKSTVKRILGDGQRQAALGNVEAVARALGMSLNFEPILDSVAFQEREARRKAEGIMSVVHGSSALETQAVDRADLETMVQRTVHELVAGPKRRLWAI